MGEEGQAMTEFAISFPVILLCCMVVIQLALLYQISMTAQLAAYRAARSAAILLQKDEGGQNTGFFSLETEAEEGVTIAQASRAVAALTMMPVSANAFEYDSGLNDSGGVWKMPPLLYVHYGLFYAFNFSAEDQIANMGDGFEKFLNAAPDTAEDLLEGLFEQAINQLFTELLDQVFSSATGGLLDPGDVGLPEEVFPEADSAVEDALQDALYDLINVFFPLKSDANMDSAQREGGTIAGAISAGQFNIQRAVRMIIGRMMSATQFTTVEFLDPTGAEDPKTTYRTGEDLYLIMKHQAYLTVPIAASILGITGIAEKQSQLGTEGEFLPDDDFLDLDIIGFSNLNLDFPGYFLGIYIPVVLPTETYKTTQLL